MTNLDWRQSFFQRVKVFGSLETPLGGSMNIKQHEAKLGKRMLPFQQSALLIIFENFIFLALFILRIRTSINLNRTGLNL